MARKISNKIVRAKPRYNILSPVEDFEISSESIIHLHLEEWESLRLVDYLGLSQQEASESMDVSRQTVQTLLQSARKKVSRSIVESLPIMIKGGNYSTELENIEGMNKMKLAITYENNQVFPHFGRTPNFKIYEIENGNIIKQEIIQTPASGHGALVDFLVENKVNTLICGGIGGGAVNALQEAGIAIYSGASGEADAQVNSFIKGQLPLTGTANCNHHHEHNHQHKHGEGEGGCHNHKHMHGEEGCHGHNQRKDNRQEHRHERRSERMRNCNKNK